MSAREAPPTNGKLVGTATRPFSIRLTDGERALLAIRAGGQPLGTYVRERILADQSSAARGRGGNSAVDREGLARVLAALGRSGIALSLAELADAARTGTLDAAPETAREIAEASAAVTAMRDDLMLALGLREENAR